MKLLAAGYRVLLLGVGCGGKDAGKNPVVATDDLPGAAVFADLAPEEPQLLLAYVEIHKVGSGGTNDIYLLKTDGSEPINLTNKPAEHGPIAWSPGGSQLAYLVRDDFFIHGQNIFVINADGAGQRRLLPRYDSYGYLSWSPDGKQVAYMRRGIASSIYELQVADLSGAPPVSLIPHGVLIDTDAYDFTWLPR